MGRSSLAGEFWHSHSEDCEDYSLPGCDAVQSSSSLPTLQRNLLPQYSGCMKQADTGNNLPDLMTSLPEDSSLQSYAYAVDLMEECGDNLFSMKLQLHVYLCRVT
jgi:hypothetical protein